MRVTVIESYFFSKGTVRTFNLSLCSWVVWPALYHFNFLFLKEPFNISFKFFSISDWSVPGVPWTLYIFFINSFTPGECFGCNECSQWDREKTSNNDII